LTLHARLDFETEQLSFTRPRCGSSSRCEKRNGCRYCNGRECNRANGKLIVKNGKTNRELAVRPDVFLFRRIWRPVLSVKETHRRRRKQSAFKTDASGAVIYLEIRPTTTTVTAERLSSFINSITCRRRRCNHAFASARHRHSGTRGSCAQRFFCAARPELEIVGSDGVKSLCWQKSAGSAPQRTAFVINKRYDANGRVMSYSFTDARLGDNGVECVNTALTAYEMGVKNTTRLLPYYYTGVDLISLY